MQRPNQVSEEASNIVGLWVLLVENEGQLTSADAHARVPMMARAGNEQTFLLGFKNMINARKFLQSSALENAAELRMVVKGNRGELLRIARDAGVTGILVDYDPVTQGYTTATELS